MTGKNDSDRLNEMSIEEEKILQSFNRKPEEIIPFYHSTLANKKNQEEFLKNFELLKKDKSLRFGSSNDDKARWQNIFTRYEKFLQKYRDLKQKQKDPVTTPAPKAAQAPSASAPTALTEDRIKNIEAKEQELINDPGRRLSVILKYYDPLLENKTKADDFQKAYHEWQKK